MSFRRFPVALVLLCACTQIVVEVTPLAPQRHDAVAPDSVTIFALRADLEADSIGYEEVALISLEGHPDYSDSGAVVARARTEAARLGANGIVFLRTSGPVPHDYPTPVNSEGTYQGAPQRQTSPRRARVLAVRWWRTDIST